MKKKLIIYFISSIILILIIFGFSLSKIIHYRYRDKMVDYLSNNNNHILNKISKDTMYVDDLSKNLYNNFQRELKITVFDVNNKIKFDSYSSYDNDKVEGSPNEIDISIKENQGTDIRKSSFSNEDILFVANRDPKTGYIVRSAMPIKYIDIIDNKFVEYVSILFILVLIIALWISNRVTYVIVEPIKYLDNITTRFLKGELYRRSTLKQKDEIGSLSRKFNNMADSIEKNTNVMTYNKNRLEAIMNSMNSGVVSIDREQKVITINPYAEIILGVDEKVIGKSIKNEIANLNMQNIFKDIEGEKEIVIDFPKERVLRVKNTDIINKNDYIGTVAVIDDITDVKQLDNMRMQFVSNVTHELKTPLTSIIGFSQTLKSVEDTKTRNRFLDIIDKEAQRLTSLIDDILALSSLEGNVDIHNDKFNVDNVIDEVIIILENQISSKNIKIIKKGSVNHNLNGDRDKFKQMLINLMDNAIKYSKENGEIVISCEDGSGTFRISIIDNGIGISEENLKLIFQRFYRVSKSRSRESGGTGLGLAIVKHILVVFGGKIEVYSTLGEGSEFVITIPKNIAKDQ